MEKQESVQLTNPNDMVESSQKEETFELNFTEVDQNQVESHELNQQSHKSDENGAES